MSSTYSGLWGLELFKDDESVQRVTLEADVTYLGRLAENHIVLEDIQVSRSHAIIQHDNGTYLLIDQQSENGCFVNDQAISRQELKMGDEIGIGGFKLKVVPGHAKERAIREDHLEKEDNWNVDQTQVFSKAQLDQKAQEASQIKLSLSFQGELLLEDEALDAVEDLHLVSEDLEIEIKYKGKKYHKLLKS